MNLTKNKREKIYTFAKIKIEKVSEVTPTKFGVERKDLRFIATITQGNKIISFSEKTLPKLFKEIKKEVY